jgi:hypothetical protein
MHATCKNRRLDNTDESPASTPARRTSAKFVAGVNGNGLQQDRTLRTYERDMSSLPSDDSSSGFGRFARRTLPLDELW